MQEDNQPTEIQPEPKPEPEPQAKACPPIQKCVIENPDGEGDCISSDPC